MAILSSLPASFPSTRVWEPGYAPMLVCLEAGEGHTPEEARKGGQKPVLSTGSGYADDVLIPALAMHQCFIDQEQPMNQEEHNNFDSRSNCVTTELSRQQRMVEIGN